MKALTDEQAQATLPQLLEETAQQHYPIQIVGKISNGVLVSEEDWRALEETLYLLSVPGMRESLQEGRQTTLSDYPNPAV